MPYPDKFQGLAITDKDEWPITSKIEFKPKIFGARDIDIEIEACGVCGSDVHHSAGRWGHRHFPMVPGHEIIGKVVQVGTNCKLGFKLGERVGIGAIGFTCGNCDACGNGDIAYCSGNTVLTYNMPYSDGYISKGGFASHVRVSEDVVFRIPHNVPSIYAAPLLCAGSAAFAQLYSNNINSTSKVGIVGIGGIGHMAVLFAKYFGAEVIAFDTNESKRELTVNGLKADYFVNNLNETELNAALETSQKSLDLLIISSDHLKNINWNKLIKFVKRGGKITTTAEPPSDEKIILDPFALIGVSLEVGLIASKKETDLMFQIVSDNNLKFFVEELPICAENLTLAFKKMDKSEAKFGIVLTQYDEYFK